MVKTCEGKTRQSEPLPMLKVVALMALTGCMCLQWIGSATARTNGHRARWSHAVVPVKNTQKVDSPGAKRAIWWNPKKGPTEITAQDLENGGKAFDGFIVQYVRGSHDSVKSGDSLAWGAFSDQRYTLDASDIAGDYVGDSLDALRNLPSSPMPDRFVRINASPYNASKFDWTDDSFWDTVVKNLTVVSEMCQKAHLTGVFLDTEPYHHGGKSPNLFMYNEMKFYKKTRDLSFDQMSDVVEKRGNQVIKALNSHCPNMTIIVSFGYITMSQHVSRRLLSSHAYLLAPFLDGMLDGSSSGTRFVDGFEGGYWHDDSPGFFDSWAHNIKGRSGFNVKFQKYGSEFMDKYDMAVGLFLDRDRGVKGKSGEYGWCGDGKNEVFYSPDRLAYTVQQAANASDKYVWIYTQKPNAWLPPDAPGGLPSTYIHAIRDGLRHANDPSLQPLSPNNSPAPESSVCK